MQKSSCSIIIPASSTAIFDLVHNYDQRLDWDPFLRKAILLENATHASVGVSSRCSSRWSLGGFSMETIYISFKRPNLAAVKMTRGPFFLKSFAASIRHHRLDDHHTKVTYQYSFQIMFPFDHFLFNKIIQSNFNRETSRRLSALSSYLEQPHKRN